MCWVWKTCSGIVGVLKYTKSGFDKHVGAIVSSGGTDVVICCWAPGYVGCSDLVHWDRLVLDSEMYDVGNKDRVFLKA